MSVDLLQRLVDESDLADLLHRDAFGLDHEDWGLWRGVFADEVVMDMSDDQPDAVRRGRRISASGDGA